jgi:hypothetical protein
MTIENDALCDDLRAWMKSPAMGLSNYSADPVVQRRVGRILAGFGVKYSSRARRKPIADSVPAGLPFKPKPN